MDVGITLEVMTFPGKGDMAIYGLIKIFNNAGFQTIRDMGAQGVANVDMFSADLNLHGG